MVQQLVDQWYFDILFPRSIYTLDDGTGRSRFMKNHCRYKNEQLDLAEQKGGSSNVVDLTRRPIWAPQILSTWYVAIFELLKCCGLDPSANLSSFLVMIEWDLQAAAHCNWNRFSFSNNVNLTRRPIWAAIKCLRTQKRLQKRMYSAALDLDSDQESTNCITLES